MHIREKKNQKITKHFAIWWWKNRISPSGSKKRQKLIANFVEILRYKIANFVERLRRKFVNFSKRSRNKIANFGKHSWEKNLWFYGTSTNLGNWSRKNREFQQSITEKIISADDPGKRANLAKRPRLMNRKFQQVIAKKLWISADNRGKIASFGKRSLKKN